jgi:phosphotransferase system IIB component
MVRSYRLLQGNENLASRAICADRLRVVLTSSLAYDINKYQCIKYKQFQI